MTDAERVVLVTGAASGIGAATSLAFADRGWTVYATDVESLPDPVAARCRWLELDVTSAEQCRAVVDRVLDAAGRLDCLVNNAGYAVPGPLEDVDSDDARALFDVLVHGPHRLSQAALPALRRSGGRIVNVSSVLADHPSLGVGAYCGGKAALSAMTHTLRMELADTAVGVSLVEPAWVTTDFADSAREKLPDDRTPTYDAVYEALEEGWVLENDLLAVTPERVAEQILAAATDADPRPRYPVGPSAKFARWTEWLPRRFSDPVQRWFGRASVGLNRWL